ncbi:MAG: Uma2 family endonuclease, partial [Blastocatellia bacterium]|nr:Uma2 family endonuclease [Blastocatellia bacterium]
SEDWIEREQKSYFLWEFGKLPEVVIEIVSDREGDEDGEKRKKYAWLRVAYYAIYDPMGKVMEEPLTVYRLHDFEYERLPAADFPSLGLGLALWEGEFEGHHATWLRWVDARGELIPTGGEQAAQEKARAAQARTRAEEAEEALRQAKEELTRMEALLREKTDSRS